MGHPNREYGTQVSPKEGRTWGTQFRVSGEEKERQTKFGLQVRQLSNFRANPSLHGTIAVFFQPVELFAHLDFAVPRVLVEGVAFVGEDEQRAGNAERVQRVVQQVVFGDGDTVVAASRDHVGRRLTLSNWKIAASSM